MLRLLFCVHFILSSILTFAQDQWKDVYKESAWKDRDQWQKPNDLIQYLNLKKGGSVADIGCHEGYMTFKLSLKVGEQGRVYAVDVKQDKLDRLTEIAQKRSVKNIITIKGDYDDPKLTINSLDAAIIIDAYHEMDDHDLILQHVKKALKSGGRIVLCEAIADSRKNLSRSEQEGKHELAMNFATADLKKAGFKILIERDEFIDRTKEKGDKMWVVVAVKP